MHDMVTAHEYRYMPIRTLALFAQRLGRVFAAPATWGRLIRERGWRRPRRRLHPAAPKEGVRATGPNEIFHIDVTIIRLLDGTRAYLHAVIDNFSRRILAWKLARRLEPDTTCEVLTEAAQFLASEGASATLMADSGVENVNGQVDAWLDSRPVHRVLAQVEVIFSNSLIEAWWRSLKHNWLYLHSLDSFERLEKLVAFYVAEHTTVMPHAAFDGQTPDEVYFGRGDGVAADLTAARKRAREARLDANRSLRCETCRVPARTAEGRKDLPCERGVAA